MTKNVFSFAFLVCVFSLAGAGNVFAQALDISSGGAPTITGTVGGSVTGSSSVTTNLNVTINFGEISPSNTNSIVKVTVPIAVRSNQAYKVTATYSGAINANAQALQKSDIGFGLRNWRAMGSNSRVCALPHTIYSPFSNDPASSVSINPTTGRVQYVSDLADVTTNTTILSGPGLSNGTNARQTNDGYIFDAIFTITPQFYATGTPSATITFTISAGPSAPC